MKGLIVVMYLVFFIPFFVYAQEKGIQFEQGLNWGQILAKAKAENKYIFVDCYATWCGPCKQMDKTIYPLEKVGEYFSAHFLSVKMQMDTSIRDNDDIKKEYSDAHELSSRYGVSILPTFLFFSVDGSIVHRGFGQKSADVFISLGEEAIDPHKQYYTLLENYKKGYANFSVMPYLAREAKSLQENDLAEQIARDYTDHYLTLLPDYKLYSKKNIEFMKEFTQSSKTRSFTKFYHDQHKIDKIMGSRGYAQGLVDYVIFKEEISPVISGNETKMSPDWNRIYSMITNKYNSKYADRLVVEAKVMWYNKEKNWPEYTKYLVESVQKLGPRKKRTDEGFIASLYWNNNAWAIFNHSKNKDELNTALSWSKWLVDQEEKRPGFWRSQDIDTYANLLYKLGQKKKAIIWEKKVIAIDPENKDGKETLRKMESGQPTWPLN